MQGQFVKTIQLQNEIRDRGGYLLGYSAEIGLYVLSVLVQWRTAVYERYYRIDEEDILGYQMDREAFCKKYVQDRKSVV